MFKSTTTLQSRKLGVKDAGSIKFDITFYYNEHGVIYNWKIKVLKAFIKLGSQPSYMTGKGTIYRYRETLLNSLGYKQKSTKETKEVVELTGEQLTKIADFFNARPDYESTLKSIDAIIRGNNWTGSFAKPAASNLISDEFSPGTIMLLNDLVVFDSRSIDILELQCKEQKIHKLFELNNDLSMLYSYVNKKKDSGDLPHFLDMLKKYKTKHVSTTDEVEKMIKRARRTYSENIDKVYSKFPFGFTSKEDFIKCHIYEVHTIKDEIIRRRYNSMPWKELIKHVSNPENFIPLPGEVHRQFDKDNFTYKLDGSIWPVNESGLKYVNNKLENKFKKIPDKFLTKERIKYIEQRNELIFD